MPITTKQAAQALGVSLRRVQKLLSEDRILGAEKVGRDWFLPDNPKILPAAEGRSNHPARRIRMVGDDKKKPKQPDLKPMKKGAANRPKATTTRKAKG